MERVQTGGNAGAELAGAGEKGGGTRQTETNRSLRFLRKWTRIRKEYALRMEEQHQRAGTAAGGGRQSLRLTGKGGYDYRNFLEQFMVSGEEVELDLDSFDYITYWYSREHYEEWFCWNLWNIRKFTACGKW